MTSEDVCKRMQSTRPLTAQEVVLIDRWLIMANYAEHSSIVDLRNRVLKRFDVEDVHKLF